MAPINNTSTPDAAIVIQGTSNLRTNLTPDRTLIVGTDNPDIIFGTPGNDEIRALAGDDTIFGTTGDDLIDGGSGFDTVDYTNLSQAITLLPRGVIGEGNSSGGQILNIEKIIGAKGQPNAIDGSGGAGPTSFDINLEARQLIVNNVPNLGSLNFVVENFVNVTGTPNQDNIVGSRGNNTLNGFGGDDNLIGGDGNDTLIGGDGNDTLLGTTNTGTSGLNERDILTGGSGVDKFILGNASGSFYKENGNRDFAEITDFAFGEQIQLGTGDVFNIQRNKSGFNIFAVKNNQNDLIARVTISTGSTTSRNSLTETLDNGSSLLDTLPTGNFLVPAGGSNDIFVSA
jgi:Ca2+-binding RTX toxin-like protein